MRRTQGNLPRPHSHGVETRLQPGHPLLRHDVPEELVQRCVRWRGWIAKENGKLQLLKAYSVQYNCLFLFFLIFCPQGDNPNKAINPLMTGLFGAVAGAASVFGNTPLDVIKTRMQVGGMACGFDPSDSENLDSRT